MTAALKTGTLLKLQCRKTRCAESVTPGVRPKPFMKKRVSAMKEHRGVGVQSPL